MTRLGSSWSVWRMVSRRRSDWVGQVFVVLTVAVATVIVILSLGANRGLENRDARTAWRNPEFSYDAALDSTITLPPSAEDGALLVTALDYSAGSPIARSTYAVLGPNAPVPPGLEQPPAAGEVWVSPELLERATANPGILSDYLNPTGLITSDGLAHEDELAAVLGVSRDDEAFTRRPLVPIWRLDETFGPAVVNDWSTTSVGSDLSFYRLLAALGSVILIVPAVSMIGGAARMLTSRRAIELSQLRLVGATGRQAAQITMLDTLRSSVIGALAGLAMSIPALRLFETIEVGGGRWFAGDLTPSLATLAAVGVAVVVISIASAVLTLRRVNTSPLGVATNDRAGGATVLRAFALVGAMVFFWSTVNSSDPSQLVILASWACVLGSTLIVGPLIVRLMANLWLAIARGPVSMLAARRLLDEPKTAYRQVGGLALACLIAGLLASVSGPAVATFFDDQDTVDFAVPKESVTELQTIVGQLEPLTTDISIDDAFEFATTVTVRTEADATAEQIRTVVNEVVPDSFVASMPEQGRRLEQLVEDFQQASLLMITVAGVAAAVGVASYLTTSIIDQRRSLTALRLTGVPIRSLASARRRAVMVPLIVATGSAGTLGIWLGLIFTGGQLAIRPFVLVFAAMTVAVGLTLAAEAMTRPMLRRYTTDRSVLES